MILEAHSVTLADIDTRPQGSTILASFLGR